MLTRTPGALGGIRLAADVGGPQLNHLVAWFDPNAVTTSGGVVTSAPNRAPNTRGPFTQTTAAWRPTWSATGMNGLPAIHSDGTHHLDGPLAGTIQGTTGSSLTIICACKPDSAAALTGTLWATSSSTDANNSEIDLSGLGGNTLGAFRFDSALGNEDTLTSNVVTLTAAAQVITVIMTWNSSTSLTIEIRRNGYRQGITTLSPATGGAVNGQDHIGIAGQTDLLTTAFGSADWVGWVGYTMAFDTALAGTDLTFWENYVMRASGLDPTAFDPSMLGGLVLWLDSGVGVTHTTTISAQADQSTEGNNVAAAGAIQPTYTASSINAKPGGTYGGSNALSLTPPVGLPVSTSGYSAMMVVKPSTITSGIVFLTIWGNTQNGMALNAITGTFRVYAQAYIDSGIALAAGTAYAVEGHYAGGAGGAITSFVNGTAGIGGTFSPTQTTETELVIGALTAGAANGFHGDIDEAIIYTPKLSSGDAAKVRSYLSSKYALGF